MLYCKTWLRCLLMKLLHCDNHLGVLMKFSFNPSWSCLYNLALFHFYESTTMRMTGIMVLLALLLQSCGHRGPLFLPPAQPSVQPIPDQTK